MADPLSLAASLIAVVQVTGSVISLCYDYRRGVKDGPRDIASMLQEAKSLRDVTEQLLGLLDDGDSDAESIARWPSLKKMAGKNGAIAQCQEELQRLEERLKVPVEKWKRISQRLFWPLQEKEVSRTLESIHRLKGIVEFGLMADTSASVLEIRDVTRDLRDRMLDFLYPNKLSKEEELQVVLEWLDAPDQSSIHLQVRKKRSEGTGNWLLSNKKYAAWKETDTSSSSSLWLHGIPGCGKSVLTSAVIDDIKHTSQSSTQILLAYYYMDYGNAQLSHPLTLLRSLVAQLSVHNGQAWEALTTYAREKFHYSKYPYSRRGPLHNGIEPPCVEGLLKALKGATEELTQLYLVIDALDESADQEEILQLVENMLSWKAKGLHIFLSSRHEAGIAALLEGNVDDTITAESIHVNNDIECFVQYQLKTHPKLRKWPPGLRKEIQVALINGAHGMFRWVDCQLSLLVKCVTIKDVRKTLKSLPKSLSDVYATTITNIDDMHFEYAIKILMWLAVSAKPLNLEEAVEVLAVDLDQEGGRGIFDQELRLPDPMDVLLMCSTLVTYRKTIMRKANHEIIVLQELRLAHHTVKEYLLSECFKTLNERESVTIPFTSVPGAYGLAAEISLIYLLHLQEPLTPDLMSEFPLLRYAAEHWIDYFKKSDISQSAKLKELVLELLKDNGNTEPYRNWYKLFDPCRKWRKPDLTLQDMPSPLYFACHEGLEIIVPDLIAGGSDIYGNGEVHKTCLQVASHEGHVGIVKALLLAGVDPDRGGGAYYTPLITASAAGQAEIVKLLLQHGAFPDKYEFSSHGTALTEASRKGHVEVIRALIDGGANPNEYHRKPRDVNPVEAAAERGYLECVSIMLPKASTETALRGLDHAVDQKDRKLLELFVDYVPDAVLDYAAGLGLEDLVTSLLKKGAKLETVLNTHYMSEEVESSALVSACVNGHLSIAEQLIAHGANVNARAEDFMTPYALASAADGGYMEIVELLLRHGADVNAFGGYGPALQIAVFKGHKEIALKLLQHGASLEDGRGSYGGPVQAAVLSNNFELLQLFLDAGVDINMPAGETRITGGGVGLSGSPIQAAVRASNVAMLDWLLSHGADVNLCNNLGRNYYNPPLIIAIEQNNIEMVDKLLAAGASITQKDHRNEQSPLYIAVNRGYLDIVNRLLSAGANPNEYGTHYKEGEVSVLTQACINDNVKIVHTLLEAGADVNQLGKLGKKEEFPIHTAAASSSVDVVKMLVEHGADSNSQLKDGWTPLHLACRRKTSDVARLLVSELGADPMLPLMNGSLAIHSAASWNSPQCISLLVEAGIDINSLNNTGRTPLHWAAESGSPDAVEWLFNHDADDTIKERGTNMTAADYAHVGLANADYRTKDAHERVVELFQKRVPEEVITVDEAGNAT